MSKDKFLYGLKDEEEALVFDLIKETKERIQC